MVLHQFTLVSVLVGTKNIALSCQKSLQKHLGLRRNRRDSQMYRKCCSWMFLGKCWQAKWIWGKPSFKQTHIPGSMSLKHVSRPGVKWAKNWATLWESKMENAPLRVSILFPAQSGGDLSHVWWRCQSPSGYVLHTSRCTSTCLVELPVVQAIHSRAPLRNPLACAPSGNTSTQRQRPPNLWHQGAGIHGYPTCPWTHMDSMDQKRKHDPQVSWKKQ